MGAKAKAKAKSGPIDLTKRLEKAEASAASRALPEALAVMLDCWREKEIPALADAIDLVSKAIRRGQTAIEGKTGAEKWAAWTSLAREQKPDDLERLFESAVGKSAAETQGHLDELARWPRDPRLYRLLVGWMGNRPFTSGPFWTRVLEVVVETADPRALAEHGLPLYLGGGEKLRRARKKLAERFPEGGPLASGEEASILSRIRAHVADAVPTPAQLKSAAAAEAELLRAIHENPGDDQPRLVYADWLLEQGKPRGEFIQLQLARAQGRAAKGSATRERKLLDAGWKDWLGGLDGLMHKEGMRFERGFADTLELVRVWSETAWARPAWSTVRVLDLYHRPSEAYEMSAIARGDWWRSLRAMLAVDPRALATLSTSPLAERLEAVGLPDWQAPGDAWEDLLARFPKLDAIHYRTRNRIPPSVIAWTSREKILASRARRLRLRDGYDTEIDIARDPRGAFTVVHVALASQYVDLPVAALEAMTPGTVTEIRVESARRLAAGDLSRVRAACERLHPAALALP